MHKAIFLINKQPDLDHAEFRQYWSESHSQIAAKLPGLRKYVQNHALPDPNGNQPVFDGFAELWFDDTIAFAAALESPEGVAALEDVQNFANTEKMIAFDVEEIPIV